MDVLEQQGNVLALLACKYSRLLYSDERRLYLQNIAFLDGFQNIRHSMTALWQNQAVNSEQIGTVAAPLAHFLCC